VQVKQRMGRWLKCLGEAAIADGDRGYIALHDPRRACLSSACLVRRAAPRIL
jgi:hypothetical protein